MIEHLITHIVTGLSEWRLKRDALVLTPEELHTCTWHLRYSGFFRAFWSILALFWCAVVGLFIWVWVEYAFEAPLLVAAGLFAAFGAFSLATAWDSHTQVIEVSPWGLSDLRLQNPNTSIPWSEIQAVTFVTWLDSYRVVSIRGPAIRFSMHISNLPRFKAMALKHAPPASIARVRTRLANPSAL